MKNVLNSMYKLSNLLCAVFILSAIFLTTLAFAEDAPKVGESILSLISAIKVGSIGAILLALGQLLKSDLVAPLLGNLLKNNTKIMPWILTGISVIISIGTSLVQGKPWYLGAVEGIMAALAANGVFDHAKVVTAA